MATWSNWLARWSPDAVFLGLFASAPLVVLLLMQLVTVVSAWLGVARTSAKALRGTRRAARAASRLRPVRVVGTVLITAVVPLAQALMLGVCYLAGNFVSAVVDASHPINGLFTAHVTSVRQAVDLLRHALRFDAIAGTYTLLVGVLMVASYRFAMNDRALSRIARCVALPGLLLLLPLGTAFVLVVAGSALIVFVSLLVWLSDSSSNPLSDASEFWATAVPIAAVTGVVGMFVLSCRAAVFGSRTVVRAWRILPDTRAR